MPAHTRRAQYADLPAIAALWTAAFWTEDAVGRAIHIRKDKHPDDVRDRYWARILRSAWWDCRHHLLVAVDDGGAIAGAADWVRLGPSTALRWWDWRRLPVLYASLTNWLLKLIRPNRAAEPTMLTAWARATPFFAHYWTGNRAEVWNLATLGVSPEMQHQGFGRMLVQWGLNRARAEGVAASVVASEGSEGFYMRCGFREVVGNVCEGEGNPLSGVKGGAILFRDADQPSEVALSD